MKFKKSICDNLLVSAQAKCLMHVTSEARDKDIATDLRAKTESCNQSNKS